MNARELVAGSLDNPALLDRLDAEADLQAQGVNSGEMIRIALRCEEVLGRPLSDDELTGISSLRDVEEVLRGAAADPTER